MTEYTPRAVVTAGTGGIGLETALGLARRGWDLTLVGRDPDRGRAAVSRVDGAAGAAPGASSARICRPWPGPGCWGNGSPVRAASICW